MTMTSVTVVGIPCGLITGISSSTLPMLPVGLSRGLQACGFTYG
jgi:hypothetical protein